MDFFTLKSPAFDDDGEDLLLLWVSKPWDLMSPASFSRASKSQDEDLREGDGEGALSDLLLRWMRASES